MKTKHTALLCLTIPVLCSVLYLASLGPRFQFSAECVGVSIIHGSDYESWSFSLCDGHTIAIVDDKGTVVWEAITVFRDGGEDRIRPGYRLPRFRHIHYPGIVLTNYNVIE